MKKVVIFTLFALMLLACQKQAQPQGVKYKEVVFYLDGIVGSMPTKASSSQIVEALRSITPPTNIELTLRSKTVSSRVIKVTVGKAQAIPIDSYTVTGEYAPESGYTAIYKGRFYAVPTYKVDTEVTITASTSAYSVVATYTCLAIVFDMDASSSIQIMQAGDGTYLELKDKLATSGNVGMGFIYTWTNWTPLRIKVFPTDEANYEAVTYTINVEQSDYAQWCGKYYYYPVNHVATESGSLGISFPQWVSGT